MKNMTKKLKTIASISLLILTFNSQASDLTIPNQFTSGTRAVAADVNANFDAAAVAVTDNQTQLTDLIAQITALTATVNANSATIASLETENSNLQAEVDALQIDSVAGLSGVLSVGTDNQGNAAAIFSGVNLHVNNGVGQTDSINGLGNFIVGYDEVTDSSNAICSLGVNTDQTTCVNQGDVWSNIHKSGSHNLIIGSQHNYSQFGAFIAGRRNSVNRSESSILGGFANLTSGFASSVSGGAFNLASGDRSSVIGGSNNVASGYASSVSGGGINDASGFESSISGGQLNIASGTRSSINGGRNNIALAQSSSISGGSENTASGQASIVGGGTSRSATGLNDWVAGSLFESN